MTRISKPRARRGRTWALLLAAAVGGCARSSAEESTLMTYGPTVRLGNGTARTYVAIRGGTPQEVGVVLTEAALSGLPSAHHEGGVLVHGHTTFETVLSLPEDNPTPFRHVLLNWNPEGHEPPGIYDFAHLDFHFYLTSDAERLAIDPSDPDYQRKAEREPAPELIPQGYVLPEPLAFPRMGVHWVDPASRELNGETFTHTFIFGSWDGRLTFAEPMITKAFLESKSDASAPVPLAQRYEIPGYYPTAYHVRWDADAREYRVALGGLVPRT